MSNEQEHNEEHAVPIKTPKQLIVTIALSFLIPILVILLLVKMVTSGATVGSGSDTLTEEAINQRIAPVAGFALVDANAPRVFQTGEQVFQAVCTACHTTGVANAPKIGDQAAWGPLLQTGYESLLSAAIKGKGTMPAKGGNPALSDYEVARAVVYMANKSGGSLEEPAAPEPDTPTAAAKLPPAAGTQPTQVAAAQAATPAPVPSVGGEQPGSAINPAGEKLFKSTCFACHNAGIAGAPKFADKVAWAPYIATGMDTMVQVVLKGKGAMPPKGGAMNASEDDIRAAVDYMVNAAK